VLAALTAAGDDRRVETPELYLEGVSWATDRPGSFRRWAGLVALSSLFAGSLSLGTNTAKILPGTYGAPHPASSAGGPLLMVAFFSLMAYVLMSTIRPEPIVTGLKSDLRVRDGHLDLTGEAGESIALSDIEAGWEDALGRVVFRLRGGRELTVSTGEPSRASDLLAAAGVEQRVARLPVGSAVSAFPLGKVLGGIAVSFVSLFTTIGAVMLGGSAVSVSRGLMPLGALAFTGLTFGALLLALLAALRVLAPRTAVVGKDGVAVEGLFFRRFLPYSEIAAVTADDRGVTLTRRRGLFRKVRLPRAPGGDGVLPRVQAAMKARGASPSRIQLERLDRRGRAVEEWLNDLKGMTDRSASDYRTSAWLPEQLAAVVEDAAASPERRLAAAASIAASGDPEARTRVRIAAETSADLELRAALEQAAEGEIPEEALKRVTRST